ncbi:MAG: ribonuclease HII [Bdellovibrio sp.]|nr:MAG: ribonuclease HII [Bdellovibrio sp.]
MKRRGALPIFPTPLAGCDEVGRGCLAGPVFAAAVVLQSKKNLSRLRDSKLLSEKEREEIAPCIWNDHAVGLSFATVAEIDEINILQASFLAMRRALADLLHRTGLHPAHVVVDGHLPIPGWTGAQTPVVDGDAQVKEISAASIVAKVARDQIMREWAERYPQYDFEKNKGYGSKKHREALQIHGPCPIHRKTFSGVKELLA